MLLYMYVVNVRKLISFESEIVEMITPEVLVYTGLFLEANKVRKIQ